MYDLNGRSRRTIYITEVDALYGEVYNASLSLFPIPQTKMDFTITSVITLYFLFYEYSD